MSWDATLTQQFIQPLIDNLIAVLQAGEVAVHTEVNGGEAMPTYQRWRRGKWIWTDSSSFPSCSVIPRRTRTLKGEDNRSVDETHSIEIYIEDIGNNPDTLAQSAVKRVQAAHIIIERATLSSLFTGYEPSRTRRPYWDIDHDYAPFWSEKKSTYKQNASLIITFIGLTEKT